MASRVTARVKRPAVARDAGLPRSNDSGDSRFSCAAIGTAAVIKLATNVSDTADLIVPSRPFGGPAPDQVAEKVSNLTFPFSHQAPAVSCENGTLTGSRAEN